MSPHQPRGQKRLRREEELLLSRPTEGEGEFVPQSVAFNVTLPSFEGPLDLLLHLIREHKLDILDIPISLITERYLAYLNLMQALDVDVAAEFLVMAATLAHIKSRMLLPREESLDQESPQEDGEDPRAALVKRLLEYQKYRAAGEALGRRAILGRDLFRRPQPEAPLEEAANDDLGFREVSVFKLIEAFDHALKTARIKMAHEVVVDRLSLSESINEVAERVRAAGRLSFTELLLGKLDDRGRVERSRVLITFLALLEMAKLRLLKLRQDGEQGEIFISMRGDAILPATLATGVNDDYRS
jgi:segregation and condensation protein A